VRIGGGEGELLALSGENLEVVSPKAFAPGAPVRFEVEEMELKGRCVKCKRGDDGRFELRLRMVNLRRAHRERLAALIL